MGMSDLSDDNMYKKTWKDTKELAAKNINNPLVTLAIVKGIASYMGKMGQDDKKEEVAPVINNTTIVHNDEQERYYRMKNKMLADELELKRQAEFKAWFNGLSVKERVAYNLKEARKEYDKTLKLGDRACNVVMGKIRKLQDEITDLTKVVDGEPPKYRKWSLPISIGCMFILFPLSPIFFFYSLYLFFKYDSLVSYEEKKIKLVEVKKQLAHEELEFKEVERIRIKIINSWPSIEKNVKGDKIK